MTSRYNADTKYKDIDRRISQDSSNYELEHAHYVDRWVEEVRQLSSLAHDRPVSSISKSPTQTSEWSSEPDAKGLNESPGNVIGIRGLSNSYSSNNMNVTAHKSRHKSHRRQMKCNKYNLLKINYSKLQGQFSSLRDYIDKSMTNMDSNIAAKDLEIQQLRTMLNNSNACPHKSDINNVKSTTFELDWTRERELLMNELRDIKEKLKTRDKSSSSSQQAIDFLRQDNDKLRAQLESDANEFGRLKQDYLQLENRLKSLLEEDQLVCESKDNEMAKVRLELCRLQVYQPKLEQILETERAIKVELQKQLTSLEHELAISREKYDQCLRDLNQERTRGRHLESSETQNVANELEKWQSKFRLLQRTLWQGEERSRLLESKLEQLEKSRSSEIESTRERARIEKVELARQLSKCQNERDMIATEMRNNSDHIKQLRNEAESLRQKLKDCSRELELSRGLNERSGLTIERLENDSTRVYDLTRRLKEMELRHRQICSDFESSKLELETWKRDSNQAKQRLILQQRAHDEYRERKEKELARLRVNLNFEQYQRQIALENIERELKSSVRELETMKCRFGGSRNSLNKSAKTTTTTATSTTNASASTTKATASCNSANQRDANDIQEITTDLHQTEERNCAKQQSTQPSDAHRVAIRVE